MKHYLIPESGRFYKANLHTHTTVSDGCKTPEEIKEIYKAHGYSVVAFTDHDVMIEHSDLNDEDFLAITSHEVETNGPSVGGSFLATPTYHLNFYAKNPHETNYACPNPGYAWGNARAIADTQDYYKGDYARRYSVEGQNEMIAEANAKESANKVAVEANQRIAEQNTTLAIREAELKKDADIKKAEADAAYDIQKQEQRKTIEVTSANADIARREKEAELFEKEIALQEKKLDAEIKKKADALKYEAEKKAEADLIRRQKESEAKRYEQEQEALARMKAAEAEKYEQERQAEAKRAIAEAEAYAKMKEAEGIRAVGLAEAEAIEKKAEAQKTVDASADSVVKALEAEIRAQSTVVTLKNRNVSDAQKNVTELKDSIAEAKAKAEEAIKEQTEKINNSKRTPEQKKEAIEKYSTY